MHYRNILATLLAEQVCALTNATLEAINTYLAIDEEEEETEPEVTFPFVWVVPS